MEMEWRWNGGLWDVIVGCAEGRSPYFGVDREGQGKVKKGDDGCLLYDEIGEGPPNSIIIEKRVRAKG